MFAAVFLLALIGFAAVFVAVFLLALIGFAAVFAAVFACLDLQQFLLVLISIHADINYLKVLINCEY